MLKPKPPIRIWQGRHFNFLGVPKCGVTTVCKAIEADINKDWLEASAPEAFSRPTITVIRHPADRFISAFFECKRRGTLRPGTENISDFLDSVEVCGFFDEHTRPMEYYLQNYADQIVRFLHTDTLAADMERLGLTDPGRHNITPVGARLRVSLTDEQVERLKKIYKWDFGFYAAMDLKRLPF